MSGIPDDYENSTNPQNPSVPASKARRASKQSIKPKSIYKLFLWPTKRQLVPLWSFDENKRQIFKCLMSIMRKKPKLQIAKTW
jgi:hypothetical protein